MKADRGASFLAFFLAWAERQRWEVPEPHVRICHWLEHRGPLAVLRCHRGIGKSTLLAIYNAWRYWQAPALRILHQSEADDTAYKTSRDTQHILRNHPWTRGMLAPGKASVESWWLPEALANDPRNPSMHARGVMSNVTSARADEIQNDDVEVPRNIQNPEARERLRYRLGEQVHIAVPGASRLFVGTPHTHDSIYDDMQRLGADCLTIKMFASEHRIEAATERRYSLGFVPEVVFAGIGEPARLLEQGADWRRVPGGIEFVRPPGGLVDLYAGVAWPQRFDRAELLKRRRQTRTINEWDSQYQLHSRPVHETRLDPDKMQPYAVEPVLRQANGEFGMWLGQARIVGASCKWDPSSGKLASDASTLALVLQDDRGRRYWHRALALTGEVAEFDATGRTITGGQVAQIVALVRELAIPRIVIETNGAGTFAPAVLKAALKQARLQCGVTERHETLPKNRRILEAIEPPLRSGTLWAHTSVIDGPAYQQMRDWNPAVAAQPDDFIDALAGAVTTAPERIGRVASGLNTPALSGHDWRPDAGVHEVEVEF